MYGIANALGQAGLGAVEGAIAADERQRGRMVQDRAFTLQENQDKRAQAFSDSFLEDANLRRIDEQVRNEIKASGGDAGGAIPKGDFTLAMAHADPYGSAAPAEEDAPQKFAMTLGEPAAPGAKAAPKKSAPAFGGTGGPIPADTGSGQPAAKATKKTLDYAGNADSALERANSNLALARRLDENMGKELEKNPYGSLDRTNPQYQAAIRWAAGKREKLEGARNAAYASALQAKHEADWAQTQSYMRNAALAIRSGDDAAVVKYATPLLGDSARYLTGLKFDKKQNAYLNAQGIPLSAAEISAMLSGDQGKIIDAAEKFGEFLVKNKQAEATMAQASAAHVNPTEQLLQAQWKSDYGQYIQEGKTPAQAKAQADADLRFNRSRALPDAKLQTQIGVAQIGGGARVLQGALSNPAFAGVASDPAFQEMLKQGIIQMVPGVGGQNPAAPPANGLTLGGPRAFSPAQAPPAAPAAPSPKAPAFPKAILDGMKRGKIATAPDGSKWSLVNGVPQQINGR